MTSPRSGLAFPGIIASCATLMVCHGQHNRGLDEVHVDAGQDGDAQPDPDAHHGGTIICARDAGTNDPPPGTHLGPEHRQTVTGDNGSFVDECDEQGNLVEYMCEISAECDGFPNPQCTWFQTGDVVPQTVDCAGSCSEGTCVARCPDFGDVVEYIEYDGEQAIFDNETDGRRYECRLVFDNQRDDYNCRSGPAVGDRVVISALGLQSEWCTGTQSFGIGTGEPQQCSYECSAML